MEGYTHAKSKFKYLRFITGRHDLPFYYHDEALLQKSFLDAFLKGDDSHGWSEPGKVPSVSVILREGNVGFNNSEKEKTYQRREESEWPLRGTVYEKYYLLHDGLMTSTPSPEQLREKGSLRWETMVAAPLREQPPGRRGPPIKDFSKQSRSGMIQFTTSPFQTKTEFTGHIVAHLNVSLPAQAHELEENLRDIDLFLTIRHLDGSGAEIYYTGTAGDPVPVSKGWLRCSLRKTDSSHPWHRPYFPRRNYSSSDVQPIIPGEVYDVDVEIWPTNVIVSPGHRLVFEVSGADTQGCGVFTHESPTDRPEEVFKGHNEIHFGTDSGNYLLLPRIPDRST